MDDSFHSSCLNRQLWSGHGLALDDQGLTILSWTWADLHLGLESAKMRDGYCLEHQILGTGGTTKGLGEHIGEERRKANVTNRKGTTVKDGLSEKAGCGSRSGATS